MTTELWILAWSAALCLLFPLTYAPLYQQQVGLDGLAGNRDDVPEPKGAAGRGLRAHKNLVENLVPFAAIVLVAHVAHVSNAKTILGAELFLGARIVHAVSYLLGVRHVRTLAYAAGVAGCVIIFTQLF